MIAAGLLAWALREPGGAAGDPPRWARSSRAILSAPVLVAFWLVALPSVLSGALDVLAPLRLDELGASGIAVGAVFLVAAAVEAVVSPAIGRLSDRRGRMCPIRAGLAASSWRALIRPPGASCSGSGVRRGRAGDEPDLDAAMALLSDAPRRPGSTSPSGPRSSASRGQAARCLAARRLTGLADATRTASHTGDRAALFALTLPRAARSLAGDPGRYLLTAR